MASIIENLQQQLGVQINKIDINDPNQQHTSNDYTADLLAQATIPTVLTGALQTIAAPEVNHYENLQQHGVDRMLNNRFPEVAQAVAAYAQTTPEQAGDYLQKTYHAFQQIVNQSSDINNTEELRTTLQNQETEILSYLPGSLGLGEKLGIDALDDRSNKFQGPLSSLANKMFPDNVNNGDDRTE